MNFQKHIYHFKIKVKLPNGTRNYLYYIRKRIDHICMLICHTAFYIYDVWLLVCLIDFCTSSGNKAKTNQTSLFVYCNVSYKWKWIQKTQQNVLYCNTEVFFLVRLYEKEVCICAEFVFFYMSIIKLSAKYI